jgi:hypothetical protein
VPLTRGSTRRRVFLLARSDNPSACVSIVERVPHELPNEVVVAVAIDGAPVPGAWVRLDLLMQRKNDYRLLFGPTNSKGALAVTRAEIERSVRHEQLTGLMDFMGLGDWIGEIVVTPLNREAVERAREGHRVWAQAMPELYAPDFLDQMDQLTQRLAANHGRDLDITAMKAAVLRLTPMVIGLWSGTIGAPELGLDQAPTPPRTANHPTQASEQPEDEQHSDCREHRLHERSCPSHRPGPRSA